MSDLGKIIMFFGAAIFILGLILVFSQKIPFLGKLPGDIFIKRDGFTLYFPIVTSILISLLLTLIINLFMRK